MACVVRLHVARRCSPCAVVSHSPLFVLTESVQQMLDESKKLIRRRGFGLEMFKPNTRVPWTSTHLWKTMRALLGSDYVKYDQVLVSVFEGNEAALQGLIENNLLSITVLDGVKNVSAFSPLFLAAFREIMMKDKEFTVGMDKFCKNVRRAFSFVFKSRELVSVLRRTAGTKIHRRRATNPQFFVFLSVFSLSPPFCGCQQAEITKELTNIENLENELVRLGRFMYHEYKLGLDSQGVKNRVDQIDKDLEVAVVNVAKKKVELAAIV